VTEPDGTGRDALWAVAAIAAVALLVTALAVIL
jgi:hypothetical protein